MAYHLTIIILTNEQYEEGKRYDTMRWFPRVVGVQYAAGELQRIIFRKNEETEAQWEKNTQLWRYLVVKVKSDAVKNNIP